MTTKPLSETHPSLMQCDGTIYHFKDKIQKHTLDKQVVRDAIAKCMSHKNAVNWMDEHNPELCTRCCLLKELGLDKDGE